MRYLINISFIHSAIETRQTPTLVERTKTLKEAQDIISMIDETVKKAFIQDLVNNKMVFRYPSV